MNYQALTIRLSQITKDQSFISIFKLKINIKLNLIRLRLN